MNLVTLAAIAFIAFLLLLALLVGLGTSLAPQTHIVAAAAVSLA